ncbi:MAG: hypothetical protein E7576_02770 [Ruminococcaceae bacterium]|jgi:O-antigen ligase|nr:hypothetical protein [Oscillospiraceae bacterium]
MNGQNGRRDRGSVLVGLFRGSRILGALDRFTVWVYALLKNGLFGWMFSGYREAPSSRVLPRIAASKTATHLRELRFGICRRIESSLIVNGVRRLARLLLGCRLKVWGTFLLSFTVFSAIQKFLFLALEGKLDVSRFGTSDLLFYAIGLAAIPLILSKKTLAEGIADSAVGRLFLRITAFREEDLAPEGNGGHLNVAFLSGIFFGILTYWIPAYLLPLGLIGLTAAYLILIRPELGVLALFFAMPWLPTMVLAALVIYTALCLMLKLFRRKRILKLEPVDLYAAAFALLTFFGGAVSLSSASLKPGLLMVCFMMGYFLTVTLMRSREWLVRCSTAVVVSAALISLYGIYLYFTDGGYSSKAWLDSEMFESIRGRAVATLENPNMLGEYLILIFPVAAAMFVGNGEGLRRLPTFVCAAVMGVCLILTWSRGAWLGLMAALLIFLFMWHRRSVWLILAGIASLPILPAVLPASILHRITSIGNMADSSTSYRVYIWRASVRMIRDHFLTGIGIGEGAWFRVYPLYAYQGVEVAPHSHNLFLQIWLELGVVGIAVFVIFLFLLFQAAFTLFRELSGERPLRNRGIMPAPLQKEESGLGTVGADPVKRARNQLRISAAGPLCGIAAVLAQGLTDYAWYNYRLFLMFWLMAALAAGYVRNGREQFDDGMFQNDPTASESLLPLSERAGENGGKRT